MTGGLCKSLLLLLAAPKYIDSRDADMIKDIKVKSLIASLLICNHGYKRVGFFHLGELIQGGTLP